MPKAAVLQSGFTTGEVSPLFYGAVENPRYKKALELCENYIPTLQGPLLRRPATKYAANVKDSANPPVFIPFKFSATQNYMLEFGDQYIRFFANNGEIVTVGTTYKLAGLIGTGGIYSSVPGMGFYATRGTTVPQNLETSVTSTLVTAGSILECFSPYLVADVPAIRYAQNGDTIYLFHPKYPTHKLQRQGQTDWKLQTVFNIDGPYLPPNSYARVGDSVGTTLFSENPLGGAPNTYIIRTVKAATVTGMASGTGGQIEVTTGAAHGLTNGQRIFITGTVGTTEANNYSLTVSRNNSTGPGYWVVSTTSTTTFLLLGSTFVHAWVSGGEVYPGLFADSAAQSKAGAFVQDTNRALAIVQLGIRYWGRIQQVTDAGTVYLYMGGTDISTPVVIPGPTAGTEWRLGVWSGSGTGVNFNGFGYPACGAFHQNRLFVSGVPNYPQEVDGSSSDSFENFAGSKATDLNVRDSDALSFVLSSDDSNPLCWLASTAQGLLAGNASSEWAMTPSGNSEALTPTNFNAQQTSFFGSANVAPVKIGNAVLYMQKAFRKLREMTFFFSAGTFRSNNLTEISEHITLPGVTKLGVQKEAQPLVWGLRSDGALLSMVYNRDDTSLSAGWSRHFLGGRSDSAGTAPVVYDFGFIPDPTSSFDQMWLIVKRYINGATVYTIEYMTKFFDDSVRQDDAFQGDCGGTLDVPLVITGISIASTAVVTSAAHGLSNGNSIKITNVVGLNLSSTDINGKITISNLVNEKTFVVAGVTTNTFQLNDFSGNPIASTGYSAWISGGQIRKLVTTISGLTWLENETVSVLADGGIHPDVVVSNSGVVTLQAPASKVQVGYSFKSKGKVLRAEAGAADGTALGKTRRTTRVAMQLRRCGELSIGSEFENLIPLNFSQADINQADNAVPLFSGIMREGIESAYDFNSQLCFQQSSMLPGSLISVTSFMEEFDV